MNLVIRLICGVALALGLSVAAQAQSFSVALGNSNLGQLTYQKSGNSESLSSTLSKTPMGVFNGAFGGTSRNVAAGRQFTGISKSSRKTRTVTTTIKGGRAVETTVDPVAEKTNLSDVATVPAGVIDPVMAVGKLINAKGCPKTIRIYDGRRAISLTPTGKSAVNGTLTCDIAYKVFAGPGHLSPLKISNAWMQLTYAMDGGAQKLTLMRLGSGPFKLSLTRAN